MSTWTFSRQFLTNFQSSRSDLESRLQSCKPNSVPPPAEVIQALSSEFSKLTRSLADATGSLPSYDQRQCELQLKLLEKALDELRTSSTTKSKFSFRKKEKSSEARSLTAETKTNDSTSEVLDLTPDATANLVLSSKSQSCLTLKSFPSAISGSHPSDLTISDLDNCVVDLLPRSSNDVCTAHSNNLHMSALHVRNVSNTILLFPNINGSVLLHNLSRCIIVVGCHQFRMYASKDVDVYISIASDPVIEQSSNIRFAGYPDVLRTQPSVKSSKALFVQDFSHIRSSPSPNWSIIPEDALIREWPQTDTTSEAFLNSAQNLLPRNTVHD